jgi:hypothetical protein
VLFGGVADNVTGMPTPPALTPEQRAAALAKAAQVRKDRALIKRQLKEGSLSLADALDRAADDEVIGKMRVLVLLESLPALGKVKARRVLDQVGIAESRRVKGLGIHQRVDLLRVTGR